MGHPLKMTYGNQKGLAASEGDKPTILFLIVSKTKRENSILSVFVFYLVLRVHYKGNHSAATSSMELDGAVHVQCMDKR